MFIGSVVSPEIIGWRIVPGELPLIFIVGFSGGVLSGIMGSDCEESVIVSRLSSEAAAERAMAVLLSLEVADVRKPLIVVVSWLCVTDVVAKSMKRVSPVKGVQVARRVVSARLMERSARGTGLSVVIVMENCSPIEIVVAPGRERFDRVTV